MSDASTPTSETPPRDTEGRHFLAASWSGDLAALDAAQLADRAEAISKHIGNNTSRFDVLADPQQFAVRVNLVEITHWARIRVEVLNELEQRAVAAGKRTIDLILSSPSHRARSERGAAGWGAVAVWTLLTSLCVGVWALITNGVLSAVGIDTWIALLNVIEVGGYLLGAYAAVCLLLYLTRPAPLDAHLPRRDERGASNIGLLVAGVLVFAVGILFATIGRA